MTFITVGNATQPFARMLHAVSAVISKGLLPGPIVVQSGVGVAPPCDQAAAFFPAPQFAEYLRAADVVICHGGAGTIIGASRAGHCPIVFPRRRACQEVVDDHQLEFIERLASLGIIHPAHTAGDIETLLANVASTRTAICRRPATLSGVVAAAIDQCIVASRP